MAQEDIVFKYQSSLKIRLETGIDLTDASELKIRFKKPSGIGDSWTATGDTTYSTRIFYDVVGDTIIDESGVWSFWSYVTFNDGRAAPGQTVQKYFAVEGE